MTATHPIHTENGLNQHTDTEHSTGQSTSDWMLAHEDNCENSLPLATCGSLETSWTMVNNNPRFLKSTRDGGEDNIPFLLRHLTAATTDMQNGHAPIP